MGEAFANANQLRPGDRVTMLLNGRRQKFRVAGIVLSPEFIFESRPGAALPDNRTYGIFWMPYEEVAKAFNLFGAFNSLALRLAPGASERAVIAAVDRLLEPYGGRAYGRADHPSHIRVSDEIRVLETLSIGFPLVFLSVAAFFMVNAVLSRLLNLQREQIAILKAFGFANRDIVWHYLKFAFAIVAVGLVIGGGGAALGGQLVEMYKSGPLPEPGLSARFRRARLGLAAGSGGSAAGRVQRRAPGREAPARRGDAAGAAGQLPPVAGRADGRRAFPLSHLPHCHAQH